MAWSGGFAEWVDGDTAYISVAFTWLVDRAYAQALWHRSFRKVRVGGPGVFLLQTHGALSQLEGVEVGGSLPEAVTHHNPEATFFSRGCDRGCGFCIVPAMEGRTFTLIPDAVPRPVLCDNNLSGLDAAYQQHIIDRYRAAGVLLRDANSGFEPKTFTPDVYERWKPLVNEGGGPWRFAYDDMPERADVLRVMRMLADEPAKRKRVYVLIGNEPFAECMQRIREVIEHGCEPHVQPVMKLNALERRPWVRHDWTERKLKDVARWANAFVWRSTPFAEYDRTRKNSRAKAAGPRYDADTGLFTFSEAA